MTPDLYPCAFAGDCSLGRRRGAFGLRVSSMSQDVSGEQTNGEQQQLGGGLVRRGRHSLHFVDRSVLTSRRRASDRDSSTYTRDHSPEKPQSALGRRRRAGQRYRECLSGTFYNKNKQPRLNREFRIKCDPSVRAIQWA